MAATALAQEKVWFDKASYDKAACLHFERVSKVIIQCLDERNWPNPKSSITTASQLPEELIATNAQSIKPSKKSKDSSSKAATRHRNLKKFKSDAIDSKRPIIIQQQESQQSICPIIPASGSLANEIAKARQHIKKSLQCMNGIAASADVSLHNVVARVVSLEQDNQELKNTVQELKSLLKQLEGKLNANSWPSLAICPAKPERADLPAAPTAIKGEENGGGGGGDDGDNDDVDLFGSDSEGEDAEAVKIREERLAAYAAKKSKKPALIAKSNIILDVKPWDDETDMKVMEAEVRKIVCDGLVWGAAKLVPLAFGIHKLQISCVVEDDKVSVDWLTETIQDIEEYVQSVDIAAFNKV